MPCTAMRSCCSSMTTESAENGTVPDGVKMGRPEPVAAGVAIEPGSSGSFGADAASVPPGTGCGSSRSTRLSTPGRALSGCAPRSMFWTSVRR